MSATESFATTPVLTRDFVELLELESGESAPLQLTSATIRLWNAFAPLALERRRWALAVGKVDTVQAGDPYASSGEVAVVVSGCLGTAASDSEIAAEILGPGDVVATGAARAVAGQWITGGEVYRVPLTDWIESSGLEGLTHLLNASDRRRAILERRILCATNHRAAARVADLFLSVHEAVRMPGILLSQERLGAMLGLRRTTVNGSCRMLEEAGASRTRRGEIRIVDLTILKQAACGCRSAGSSAHRSEPASA